MASPLVTDTSDATFNNDVIKSTTPVLVDFWAEWCGPCRALSPIIDQLASDYSGKLKVVKLNVDHNPNTAAAHGVRGIPTLILVKGGEVADRIVGAVPKQRLTGLLDTHLR
jgi:thioredoxin 1